MGAQRQLFRTDESVENSGINHGCHLNYTHVMAASVMHLLSIQTLFSSFRDQQNAISGGEGKFEMTIFFMPKGKSPIFVIRCGL